MRNKGKQVLRKAVGRPKLYLIPEDLELKKRKIEEQRLRTHIEGKFSQGKNGYNLAKIRAKLMKTSASWIAAIYFVMNLKKFSEFLAPIFRYCLALWPRWEQIKPGSRYESFPTALGRADNLLVLMHPISATKMRLHT